MDDPGPLTFDRWQALYLADPDAFAAIVRARFAPRWEKRWERMRLDREWIERAKALPRMKVSREDPD
jgi:hypothetical protein